MPTEPINTGFNSFVQQFATPATVRWLAGVVVVLFTACCFLAYQVKYRLPDIERHATDLRDQVKTLSDDMKDQFKTMRGDLTERQNIADSHVQEQLRVLSASVAGLKVNMARLCGRPPYRTCNQDALVAAATTATQFTAQLFDTANVQLTSGEKPAVAAEGLKAQLPIYDFNGSYVYPTAPAIADKPKLANVMLWSSAADSAHWHREGNNFKVTFANGDATFRVAHKISKEEADELVYSLNATVDALKTASTTPASNK